MTRCQIRYKRPKQWPVQRVEEEEEVTYQERRRLTRVPNGKGKKRVEYQLRLYPNRKPWTSRSVDVSEAESEASNRSSITGKDFEMVDSKDVDAHISSSDQ